MSCATGSQSGLIIAEARAMNKMSDESQNTAEVSVHASQEMQALRQVFLENLHHFIMDVRRFSHEWQSRWTDHNMTRPLAELGAALLGTLAGLEEEFSKPEGPSRQRVAALMNALLGTRDARGLLPELQRLAERHAAAPSLDDQRLQSEVDTLFIQLNGLRAQWRDYLALTTPSGGSAQDEGAAALPPLPPNPRARQATGVVPSLPRKLPTEEPFAEGPPPSSSSSYASSTSGAQRRRLPGGVGDLLGALLPLLVVILVVLVVLGGLLSHLPRNQGQGAPSAPVTVATQPTQAPLSGTPAPPATTLPRPPQLSANPSTLLLPCPGTGAATLQLANTGGAALAWQASIISASGGAPGILLDGENTESGHLNPGETTQISVTAQVRGAQGTLSITFTGESAPLNVPYSLNC